MNAYFIWKNKNELTNFKNAINQMKYDGEKKAIMLEFSTLI